MALIYLPPKGMVPNPLNSGKAANKICPCGSEKKVKKCCGKYNWMKPELAQRCRDYINNARGVANETLLVLMKEEKRLVEEGKAVETETNMPKDQLFKEDGTPAKLNVYRCEYGCQTVTVDVDKGVTPFMMKCRRKPTPERPIASKYLGEDGECIGTAQSTMYPTKNIPKDVIATHEWFAPNIEDVSEEFREHVENGGLILRPRTGKTPIFHEDEGKNGN